MISLRNFYSYVIKFESTLIRMRFQSLLFLLISLITANVALANNMYVFVPTSVKPENLENNLKSSCPNIDFKVFARFQTFVKQVNQDKPSSVLTLLPTLGQNFGYNTVLTGSYKGNAEEPYVLATLHEEINLNELTDKTIGAVDILGRKSMRQFISKLLKTNVFVKRVSKTEDLLMLLIYGSVDAIFISEEMFKQMKAKSQADLVATPTDIKVGVVGTAFRNDADGKEGISDCINKLPPTVNSLLGIKAWRKA